MRTIAMLSMALLLGACTKKDSTEQATGATETAEAAPAPAPDAPARTEGDIAEEKAPGGGGADPMGGKFTVEQATEGLEGTGKLMARIKTNHGDITCELFPDKAPETVASFVGLARGVRPYLDPGKGEWVKEKYFENLLFHRVIPAFMIQGGDILSRDPASGRAGTGGPGYTLPDEIVQDLKFDKPGRLAMANSGPGTHSGGSQFFITEMPRSALDGGYVIFGQCNEIDVVKKIARVPSGGPEGSTPKEPVTMSIEIFKK